jgi:hypothetical protein
MVSNTDEFLPQMMGFQDFELNHSTGTLTAKNVKAAAAKRLIILSLIPLLLTCIIPVSFGLVTNPATGQKLGMPCLAQSCLDLFSASVIGRCDAASNTTVLWKDYDYYYGCLRCAILVHGSFSKAAQYCIYIFSEFCFD